MGGVGMKRGGTKGRALISAATLAFTLLSMQPAEAHSRTARDGDDTQIHSTFVRSLWVTWNKSESSYL
jgi:hypothetical protein